MTELNKKVYGTDAPVTLAECVYMGDGTNSTVKDEIQIIKNSSANPNAPNKYNGKKALWLGDSISVVGTKTYPDTVCSNLNMTLLNKASSGASANRMRYILQGGTPIEGGTYTPVDLHDIDYAFIAIGHNCDGPLGIASGSIDDIPVESNSDYTNYSNGFYTDVASCIEYIRNNNVNTQIYIITPIQSDVQRYITTTSLAQEALKKIANMYSIPVIDLYSECGVCRKNCSVYTYDNIHPNTDGITKIATYITTYLLNN